MHVEICSQCHPFYTGKKKMIDTTGRVDRFKKLAEKADAKKKADAAVKKAKVEKEKAEKATPTKKEKK
jgi:large subunit ribosomal protein L31